MKQIQNGYPQISPTFVWLFVIFSISEVAGAYVDGWAHTHLSRLDTFFTPYHALFYFSFLALEILLLREAYNNHRRGYPWKRSLPKQYLFALAGVGLFTIAAAADLAWHLVFGIERGIDALLSPTHMLLSFGGAMIVSAPLHAIWYKHVKLSSLQKLPVTLSFACVFMTITFMTQFFHPFALPWMTASYQSLIANADYARVLGIANVIIFTTIILGLILTTIRHWKFPPGSFTIILTLNVLAIVLMRGQYYFFILTALIAGVLIDIFYQTIFDDLSRPLYLRLFGFIIPVIMFGCYAITILAWQGTWWSVHFVFGSVVISGLAGALMTYILMPPESVEIE